jgi:hypothetical protein
LTRPTRAHDRHNATDAAHVLHMVILSLSYYTVENIGCFVSGARHTFADVVMMSELSDTTLSRIKSDMTDTDRVAAKLYTDMVLLHAKQKRVCKMFERVLNRFGDE